MALVQSPGINKARIIGTVVARPKKYYYLASYDKLVNLCIVKVNIKDNLIKYIPVIFDDSQMDRINQLFEEQTTAVFYGYSITSFQDFYNNYFELKKIDDFTKDDCTKRRDVLCISGKILKEPRQVVSLPEFDKYKVLLRFVNYTGTTRVIGGCYVTPHNSPFRIKKDDMVFCRGDFFNRRKIEINEQTLSSPNFLGIRFKFLYPMDKLNDQDKDFLDDYDTENTILQALSLIRR